MKRLVGVRGEIVALAAVSMVGCRPGELGSSSEVGEEPPAWMATASGVGTTGGDSQASGGGTSGFTDGTGADDDSGVGRGFLLGPDGGPSDIECSIWSQDCPAGEKCMPWADDGGNAWNGVKCSPVDPDPDQAGEPCTVKGSSVSGVDSCDIGSMCWDVDPGTNRGTCIDFCTGSTSDAVCSDPSTACSQGGGPLALCLPKCDPLVTDCGDERGCYGGGGNFVCAPDASSGEGGYGEPCEFVNACTAGFACLNAAGVPGCVGSSGCCSSYCDLDDPLRAIQCEGVAGGQRCLPYHKEGKAPPGYETVGVCLSPQ